MAKLILAIFLACSLSSCLYSNTRIPLDDDLWETRLGEKQGIASNYSILWLVAWGDAGAKAAAKNGGITKLSHMDLGIESYFFGAYIRRDTIVYGE